ncbi:MAG: YkgJ family cysteine cluster protein [Planctomycetota bacterium]
MRCGACCSHFRVSFHWMEADDATPDGVPVELTRPLGFHRRCMIGTDQKQPRCIALLGTVGQEVSCAIHARRPTACREFIASYAQGRREHRCDAVRARYGLPLVGPADWQPAQHDDESPHVTRPPCRAD